MEAPGVGGILKDVQRPLGNRSDRRNDVLLVRYAEVP